MAAYTRTRSHTRPTAVRSLVIYYVHVKVFCKPPYRVLFHFFFFSRRRRLNVCHYLSWFHSCLWVTRKWAYGWGLQMERLQGLHRLVQEDEGNHRPKTHTDLRTKMQTPVTYASLPTPGCISACITVAMPAVSLTGRGKLLSQPLFLGRCVIHSLSSNSPLSEHTMQRLTTRGVNVQDGPAPTAAVKRSPRFRSVEYRR